MYKFKLLTSTFGLILGASLSVCAQDVEHDATGHSFRINPGVSLTGPTRMAAELPSAMTYHGGGVLKGNVSLYPIWYGAHTPQTKALLTSFLNGLSGSPYLNINATYPQGDGRPAATAVNIARSFEDNYSRGRSLSEADILIIVGAALSRAGAKPDQQGIYFVFTAADVQMPGFGSQFCGWHDKGRVSGTPVRFAFVGDAARYGRSCSVQPTVSPNGNPSADAMASVAAHELVETITDPNLDAWYDTRGEENADKCAWKFGNVFPVGNGSYANMLIGGNYFLIQQNWLNLNGGSCTLAY